ncbi:MAG: ABC transporter permease [Kiloniellales bacterium]|nr:ABC transporter permease [Kiloniellales bacterium]
MARARSGLRRVLGLGPALAMIGVFMLLPIGIIAVYSVLEADPYGGVEPRVSAEAYVQFFFERDLDDSLVFNPAYLVIFGRSILLAAAAMLLSLLIGFPVAYYMATQPEARRNLLVFLVTIPFWTNLLIRTFCWILILRDHGLVNNLLLAAGIIDRPMTLLYTNGAILLGLVYTYIPFMILPIYASIEKLDLRLVEAAHDLYANRRQVLRRVILPLALPGIVAGSILVFIPSVGAFIAPDLLGGGKKLMIGSLIQMQFSSSRNWPFGSAAALFLMAAVLAAMTYYALGPARRAATEPGQ